MTVKKKREGGYEPLNPFPITIFVSVIIREQYVTIQYAALLLPRASERQTRRPPRALNLRDANKNVQTVDRGVAKIISS